MADKGIIFSAPMVRALLGGRKTQTRRLLKPQPDARTTECSVSGITRPASWMGCGPSVSGGTSQWDPWRRLAYSPGDRLYVRESWRVSPDAAEGWHPDAPRGWIDYQAGGSEEMAAPSMDAAERATFVKGEDRDWDFVPSRYRPCIHMPRWTSRMWLLVTDVRVQRLQAITLGDICAEGLAASIYEFKPVQRGFEAWEALWNSLHTAEGERWQDNPWVMAVSFDVHQGNIDAGGKGA